MYEKMVLKNASHQLGYFYAQDVAQETFLKLYEYLDYLEDRKVKPWLLVVSQNMIKNVQKKLDPAELMSDCEEEDKAEDALMESAEDYCIKKEAAHELLRTAFELLYEKNPVWYEIMLDTYILEMSSKEVASVLHLTVTNVDVIKLRAKKFLNKKLGKKYHQLF